MLFNLSKAGAPFPASLMILFAQPSSGKYSWKKTYPDFKHIMWSLDDLNSDLEDFYTLPVNQYIQQCRFPAMKSDIIRLALLYKYGGIWNDLKNSSMKPFLCKFTQENAAVFAEHWPTKTVNKKLPHISNSFIAAPPRRSTYMALFIFSM